MEPGYSLFETDLGWCGIAWGPRGITRVALPASQKEETVARLSGGSGLVRRLPPPEVAEAVRMITLHLSGKP